MTRTNSHSTHHGTAPRYTADAALGDTAFGLPAGNGRRHLAEQQKDFVRRATTAAEALCRCCSTGASLDPAYAESVALTINTAVQAMAETRGLPRGEQKETSSELRDVDYAGLPVTALGMAYQAMLDIQPAWQDGEIVFNPSKSNRKAAGKFYTPPALVEYVVENALGPIVKELSSAANAADIPERLLSIRVLDPAVGCGDFLISAATFIGNSIASLTGTDPQPWVWAAAEQCVYGIDLDPMAICVAGGALWLASARPGDEYQPSDHLVCGDSLNGQKLGDVKSFHAVIGNPPYVAAKNEDLEDYCRAHGFRGQSDYYLLFLSSILEQELVRPGGYLSMVLPDPFLVRGNAAAIRRTLVEKWTMESLLHVKGMFAGAGVSNVVPVCRNKRSASYEIPVTRTASAGAGEHFGVSSDLVLAQPGAEVLYLAQEKAVQNVFPAIHGGSGSVGICQLPYQPMGAMDIRVYRGEEVGKGAIVSEIGELPILLGGQSIQPFRIRWEGRRIDREAIRKPIENYLGDKIILQKSAGRIVAAFDCCREGHTGFVVPQSVYCIRCGPQGPDYLYLLALLNSSVMNDYVYRAFTGYKLVQPQLEIEDLKRLPIRTIKFSTPEEERRKMVAEVLVSPESAIGIASYDYAARWLEEGREDLVHDLVVAMTKKILEQPEDAETRNLMDRTVGMLYGCC